MEATAVAAMIVLVVTGIAYGATGFGFSLIAVPPLLLLYEPPTVVVLAITVGMLPSLLVVASAWRETDLHLVALLLPGSLIGLLLGAQLLQLADPILLKLLTGLFVAAYALVMWRGYRPTGMGGPWAASMAGLASGVLGTATGLSGPPIIILFTARQIPKEVFRGTIVVYFIVIKLIGFAILLADGMVGAHEGWLTLFLTPPAVVGVLIGNRLAQRLSADTFRRLTLLLLLATGMLGMTTAILAFW